MNEDATPKPKRRFRLRLKDREAETVKRREAEALAAQLQQQQASKDVAGYNPYGRTRNTPRYAPGERGRIDPPELGGDKQQPNKDPFGGVSRRRG
jgi:hypothetical protein